MCKPTIEQKAKAYDEAISKMKEIITMDNTPTTPREIGEFIFPELKEENEDERIRGAIIDHLKDNNLTEWAAWLEKQGTLIEEIKRRKELLISEEEKETSLHTKLSLGGRIAMLEELLTFANGNQDETKSQGKSSPEAIKEKIDNQNCIKPVDNKVEHLIPQKGMYYTCIKDYYAADNTHLCVKGNVYKSFYNGYIDDESHLGLSWTNSCAEKYFEPTKDEDWIVCEHDNVIGKPMQYKEFKKKINQKFIEKLKTQGLTPKLRLWTIQDANSCDILYAKGSYFREYVFMFSSFTEDNVISTHFGYDVFHGTFDGKLTRFGREEDFMSVTPATKEQRDTLMNAMADAGYTFDFDKKELKKIEGEIEIHFGAKDNELQEATYYIPKGFHAEIDDDKVVVKKGEKSTTWGEDDKHKLQKVVDFMRHPDLIKATPTLTKHAIEWLESLKDRGIPPIKARLV